MVENKQRTKKIFGELCEKIEKNRWTNTKDENELLITFSVTKKDDPMSFRIKVDEETQLVKLVSYIKINVPEHKREDMALAVCAVNNKIVDGNFDFNVDIGSLIFRLTNSIISLNSASDVLDYLMECSTLIVDKYDTLLRAIADGIMTVDEFCTIVLKNASKDQKETVEDSQQKWEALKIRQYIGEYVIKNGIDITPKGELGIEFFLTGEDIEIPFIVTVDPERKLVCIKSPMTYEISKTSVRECSIAVCEANFGMADGCFEYDADSGFLEYRTEISYSRGSVNDELLAYMFNEAFSIVDKYNDKFLKFGV